MAIRNQNLGKSKNSQNQMASIFDEEERDNVRPPPQQSSGSTRNYAPDRIKPDDDFSRVTSERGPEQPTGALLQAMKEAGGDIGNVGSRPVAITAEGDAARRPPPAAPAQEEKKGSIFDVDAEGERAAFQQELEANRAKAMQQAEARAGLAGMGLSGATGQLVSDVGRQQQRAGQLAMGEFERQQARGALQDVQRQAGIWAFEEEFGVDADNDGVVGTPLEEQTPEQSAIEAERMNRDVAQERSASQEAMSSKIGRDVQSVKVTDNPFDLFSPMNKDMGTYEDNAGFTWKVYRRPDGSFFKVTA